jgi:hypothetical protein
VRVHSLTLFALPGACEVTPGSPSWPATLQPPCLGSEPKARVATRNTSNPSLLLVPKMAQMLELVVKYTKVGMTMANSKKNGKGI